MAETKRSAPKEPEAALTVQAPSGVLNLRSGPHDSYPVRAQLPSGVSVMPVKMIKSIEVPGWTPIRAGDLWGWADSRYITPEG